jgi:hypothetical protein
MLMDLEGNPELLVFAGVVVLVAAIVMALVLAFTVRLPPPAALIAALTMLTLFAIAGGMATSNDESWTIAAAGVGALAGSVTSLFHGGNVPQVQMLPPPEGLPPVQMLPPEPPLEPEDE